MPDIKSSVSILADIMTIFGISGLFTWSFARESLKERSVTEAGVSIFAYSIKAFLSLLVLSLMYVAASILHFFIILMASQSYSSEDGLWNPAKPISYIFTYTLLGLIFIPTTVLIVSSIFTWSYRPWTLLWQKFKPSSNKQC